MKLVTCLLIAVVVIECITDLYASPLDTTSFKKSPKASDENATQRSKREQVALVLSIYDKNSPKVHKFEIIKDDKNPRHAKITSALGKRRLNELLKNGDLKLRSEVEADEKRHKWEEFLGILKDAVKDRKSPDQTKRKPHSHSYDDKKLDMIIEALDSLKRDDENENGFDIEEEHDRPNNRRTKPMQRKPKPMDSEKEESEEVQPKPDDNDGEDSEDGSDRPIPDHTEEESEEKQQRPIKRRPKPTQRKPKPVNTEKEESEEVQPIPDDNDGEDSEEGIDKLIPDEIEKDDSEEEQQKPMKGRAKPNSDNDKLDMILQLLANLKKAENQNDELGSTEELPEKSINHRPKADYIDREDSEEEPDKPQADDTGKEESEEEPEKPMKRRPKPNKRRPKPDREDSEEEPDKPKIDDTDKEESEEEPEKPMKRRPKPEREDSEEEPDKPKSDDTDKEESDEESEKPMKRKPNPDSEDKLDLILQFLENLKKSDKNVDLESTEESPEKPINQGPKPDNIDGEDSEEEPDKPKADDTEKEESDEDSKEPDSDEEDTNEPTTSDEGDNDEEDECPDDLDEEQLLQGIAFVQNQLKRFLGIECTCNPTKQTVLNECILHKKSSARHRREDQKASVRAPEKQIIKNKKFTKKATQNDINKHKNHPKKYTPKTDSSTASTISKMKVIEGSDKLPLTNAEIQANILKLLKNVGISTHIVQKPTSKVRTTASQSPSDTNNEDLQFFRNKPSVHRSSTDSKSSDKKNRRKLRNRRKGRTGSSSRTASSTTAKRTQRGITSEEIEAKQEEWTHLRNYKTEDSAEEILLSRPVDKSAEDVVDHEIEDLKSLYIKYKEHADEVKRKEKDPVVSAEPAEKESEISDSEEKILHQHSNDHAIDYSYSPEVDDSTSETEYDIAHESDSNYHNLFKQFSKMIADEKDREINSTTDADME